MIKNSNNLQKQARTPIQAWILMSGKFNVNFAYHWIYVYMYFRRSQSNEHKAKSLGAPEQNQDFSFSLLLSFPPPPIILCIWYIFLGTGASCRAATLYLPGCKRWVIATLATGALPHPVYIMPLFLLSFSYGGRRERRVTHIQPAERARNVCSQGRENDKPSWAERRGEKKRSEGRARRSELGA